jgi:hypothetical protein
MINGSDPVLIEQDEITTHSNVNGEHLNANIRINGISRVMLNHLRNHCLTFPFKKLDTTYLYVRFDEGFAFEIPLDNLLVDTLKHPKKFAIHLAVYDTDTDPDQPTYERIIETTPAFAKKVYQYVQGKESLAERYVFDKLLHKQVSFENAHPEVFAVSCCDEAGCRINKKTYTSSEDKISLH